MNRGYIKIHRKLLESEVFANKTELKIWMWLLLKASHNKRYIPVTVGRGEMTVPIEIGELLFGRYTAEEELNIDGSTIYKCNKKFEDAGMIKIKSNSHFSVISIVNFKSYQVIEDEEVTAEQQQNDSQVTTKEQPNDSQVTQTSIKSFKALESFKTLPKKEYKEKNQTDDFYPDWFDDILKSVFTEYLEIRKKIKAVITPSIIKRLFNKLEQYSGKNKLIANEIMLNAINGSWKDFYALKTLSGTPIIPEHPAPQTRPAPEEFKHKSFEEIYSAWHSEMKDTNVEALIDWIKDNNKNWDKTEKNLRDTYKWGFKVQFQFKIQENYKSSEMRFGLAT